MPICIWGVQMERGTLMLKCILKGGAQQEGVHYWHRGDLMETLRYSEYVV